MELSAIEELFNIWLNREYITPNEWSDAIEKDEEQLVEVRTDSEFETEEFVYQQAPIDPVKRVYKPVREKYITIVKNSRKLYLNAFEKRGRRDLMKTQRVLRKIGR